MNEDASTETYCCHATDVVTGPQLLALGKVAAEWGMMEAALNFHGSRLLRTRFAVITGNPGAVRAAEILVEVLGYHMEGEPETVADIVATLRQMRVLAERRHNALHAAWSDVLVASGRAYSEAPTDPQNAFLFKQGGKKLKQDMIGVSDLESLAEDVAQLRYRLNVLFNGYNDRREARWLATLPIRN